MRSAVFFVSGNFPQHTNVVAIRIDPFKKPYSTVVLTKVRLLTKAGKLVEEIELDGARKSGTIKAITDEDDALILEHVANENGSKPMMVFDRPRKRSIWKRVRQIEVHGRSAGVRVRTH